MPDRNNVCIVVNVTSGIKIIGNELKVQPSDFINSSSNPFTATENAD